MKKQDKKDRGHDENGEVEILRRQLAIIPGKYQAQ